jgi:hypothetical protein
MLDRSDASERPIKAVTSPQPGGQRPTGALEDLHRIARLRGVPARLPGLGGQARFSAADRCDPRAARRMWDLYLDFYGREYWRQTGRTPTDEVYARIWNGGPQGWKRASTLPYWRQVRAALQDDSPLDER